VHIHDPALVRTEYEAEGRLEVRNRFFRELLDGPSAQLAALAALEEVAPRRVLEVGCGTGEFAARVRATLGAEVVATDISPRMIELTARRGIEARLADVQELPFDDGEFDCAFAGWMLYHVPDLERGLAELARALRPQGRLVATSFGEDMPELWELVGGDPEPPLRFDMDSGIELLERYFERVECRTVEAFTVFPDAHAVRSYLAATITRGHLAERVPALEQPLRARHVQAVFVADGPRCTACRHARRPAS
jgi:ubiquinone/menaquinone biosynthesis C-methylase UbiE